MCSEASCRHLKVTLELVMHLVLELLACVLKLLLVRLHLVLQLLAGFLQLGLHRLEVSVHLAQQRFHLVHVRCR